jgi:DNA-binding LytR/AlgR family response regulator
MKLNCFVIDDEPLARKGLKEYIGDVDFLQFIGEADSPLKATEEIAGGNVQLLFLDIQMPKVTGLQFLASLHTAPPVIFTTAYPQYALDGFELNALDYLVKPVSFDRFLKAALRAKEHYDVRTQNHQQGSAKDYLFIKVDGRLVKIFLDDILYVEALQNYVTVHTAEKKYITYLTFHSIEEFLPESLFIKTHKSYLVAIAKIEGIEANCVCIGQRVVPISRNLKESVMERLVNNRFLKR